MSGTETTSGADKARTYRLAPEERARCPRCDRADCAAYADALAFRANPPPDPDLCPSMLLRVECDQHAVDWRLRALDAAAEREAAHAALREAEAALMMASDALCKVAEHSPILAVLPAMNRSDRALAAIRRALGAKEPTDG